MNDDREYLSKAKVIELIAMRKRAAERLQSEPRGHTEGDDALWHYREGQIQTCAELLERLNRDDSREDWLYDPKTGMRRHHTLATNTPTTFKEAADLIEEDKAIRDLARLAELIDKSPSKSLTKAEIERWIELLRSGEYVPVPAPDKPGMSMFQELIAENDNITENDK